MTNDERDEYDAFGPWVAEVTSESGLPSRLRSRWPELQDADFLFKIPIDVERRLAKPGTDLYRLVVAADGTGLCLINPGPTLDESHHAWTDLRAMVLTHILLKGVLVLTWRDATVTTIDFNAVSLPLFERLIDFVRPTSQPEAVKGLDSPVKDYHQQNLVAAHQNRRPGSVVVVCDEPSGRKHGVLVLDTGSEWVVLDSGFDKRTKTSAYSTRTTYLSKAQVSTVRVTSVQRPKNQFDGWFDRGGTVTDASHRFRLNAPAALQWNALAPS